MKYYNLPRCMLYIIIWLVVWNIFFHTIWDNPSHWLILFRGVETTNQLYMHIAAPEVDRLWSPQTYSHFSSLKMTIFIHIPSTPGPLFSNLLGNPRSQNWSPPTVGIKWIQMSLVIRIGRGFSPALFQPGRHLWQTADFQDMDGVSPQILVR